jgi:filamentous hemagglutinin family protein
MGSKASLNHVYRTVWNRALGAMVAVAENTSSHGGGGSASLTSLGGSYRAAPLALTLAIALAWSGGITDAYANPQGGVATTGSYTTTTNGNQLTVTTTNGAGTSHSAINWQSFSIPAGSSTYFQQPSAASTSINRVVTNTPSLIFGTLGSNGNLVLINQSGITVGAGAVVDTAGFTASALRMSDADAVAGRMRFGDGTAAGNVSVQGSILARNGDVVLLAGAIDTGKDALIQAPNGSTLLAAGQQIEITGRGLEGISLQVQAPADSVVNLGTLKGDAVGIFASTLKHSGLIQANAVSTEGGKVVLKATDKLSIDGTVQVAALGQKGGSILASATHVKLDSTALLDASGALGGGEVLVGGGYQGKDARLANAQTTDIAAGAQLKADALVNGDGGTVVVWADGATRYRGSLSARGGAQGGNGGVAEVSGKEYLDFRGLVDLTAAHGTKGSLLLDPDNIVIGSYADINGNGAGYGTDISDGMDLSNPSTYAGETSYITASVVSSLLTTADVTLAATNDITLESDISTSGSSNAATTLTLNAGHNIVFGGSHRTIESYSNALNVSLNAGNAIATSGGYGASIYGKGGNISLTAGSGGVGSGAMSQMTFDSSRSYGAAGNITITSGGVVSTGTLSANGYGGGVVKISGTQVSTGTISVYGYQDYYSYSNGGNGGNGGAVDIVASGAVIVGGIDAYGASGDSSTYSPTSGGKGGSVTVSGGYGSNVGTVNVSGGYGGYGGAAGSGGSASVTLSSGNLVYGSTVTINGANSVALAALNGSISGSGVSAGSLSTVSKTGTNLSGNSVSAFSGAVIGTGSLTFTNTGALTIGSISVANGNVSVDNTGGITTVGAITAGGTGYGNVDLVAHSPITIGAGGINASGNIALTTSLNDPTSNVTLNGVIQSTGGGVNIVAGNNLVQNSGVIAAGGITASAGGTVSFGANGYSSGNPLSYSDVTGAVTAPLVPLSAVVSPGGAVADFLDQFLAALDEQQSFSDDPFDPRNRNQDGLVVEGQVCTP